MEYNEIKSKVLIVDDIAENIQLLANLLDSEDVDVSYAYNGEQALKVIEYNVPDLVLLDVAMPLMDGFMFCKEIKKNEKFSDIPVIFLTAKTQIEDIERAFDSGAVDYITKPFNTRELIVRINTQLELKKYRDTIKAQITHIQKQNQQIQDQNEKLKELNATRDKFFSIIAHDLKSPLTSISGFIELLKMNIRNYSFEKIEEFISMIDESSNKSISLIENLLQWSRSQTGKLRPHPTKVDMISLINNTIEFLEVASSRKNLMLIRSYDHESYAFADGNMISTVVRNLISNAIKFSFAGNEIHIQTCESNSFITICIQDFGTGIKEEEKGKIFLMGSHFTTHGTQNEEGTGLGLILCKEFIDKSMGKIWFESEINKGTKFYFTLPKYNGQN